jgi:hypothetical protein
LKKKQFNESYKHSSAKRVLASWLSETYTVRVEEFFGQGSYVFSPDVTTYTGGRCLQDDFTPFKTNARYFSDFIRDSEWINNL